jgi:hypothetical protein
MRFGYRGEAFWTAVGLTLGALGFFALAALG